PLAQNTTLEVTYVYWPLGLTYLSGGTVSSAAAVVTGNGTNFTQLIQPDFQATLPSATTVNKEATQAELILNPGGSSRGQLYRVAGITTDTALTTFNNISPALVAGSPYVLATLPEIPREHIRVIAAVALQKMYSVAGDDDRVKEWSAIATANLQMMKDSL